MGVERVQRDRFAIGFVGSFHANGWDGYQILRENFEGEDIPFIALVRNTWADLAKYADNCDLADMTFSLSPGQDDDARRKVTGANPITFDPLNWRWSPSSESRECS